MFCSRSTRLRPPDRSRPIRNSAEALDAMRTAISDPLRAETLGILLDDASRGSIVVVSPIEHPDGMLQVADCLSAAGGLDPTVASLVLATIRPNGGVTAADVDRWLEASDIAESNGVPLVEWFVIGPSGVACPRDLLGEPERWAA